MLRKFCTTILLALLTFFVMSPALFAAGLEDIPKNAALFILDCAFWLALAAGVAKAGWEGLHGNTKKAVISIVVAVLFAALCKTPNILESLGVDLLRIIGIT